jgi:hypothetical protein
MTQNKRQQRGFSRRKFMQAAAAAAGGTMLGSPALALNPRSWKSRSTSPEPDLILVDGRIHTMNAGNRIVSSVAIKNGRFVEIGNVGRITTDAKRASSTCRGGRWCRESSTTTITSC